LFYFPLSQACCFVFVYLTNVPIFPSYTHTNRADALTSTQEIALQQLVQFLDAHLLSASNEKRGVALHITTLLVQRVPADCLPLALSAVSSAF
jgi:hypothetical protein